MCRFWLLWDILFSFVPKSSLPSPVYVDLLVSFFNLSPLSLWYSSSVNLSFLHQGPANTACWRLALWVGSSCTQGTLLAVCCWLPPPPLKSLFKLFCFSLSFLLYSYFLSTLPVAGGKFSGWGWRVYVLVWCWFLHILGRLSYLHDQPRLQRIIIIWSLLMCAAKSSRWCHSCTEDTHLCVSMQYVIKVKEATCSCSCFSPPL